jgi:hypothetical protein
LTRRKRKRHRPLRLRALAAIPESAVLSNIRLRLIDTVARRANGLS